MDVPNLITAVLVLAFLCLVSNGVLVWLFLRHVAGLQSLKFVSEHERKLQADNQNLMVKQDLSTAQAHNAWLLRQKSAVRPVEEENKNQEFAEFSEGNRRMRVEE